MSYNITMDIEPDVLDQIMVTELDSAMKLLLVEDDLVLWKAFYIVRECYRDRVVGDDGIECYSDGKPVSAAELCKFYGGDK